MSSSEPMVQVMDQKAGQASMINERTALAHVAHQPTDATRLQCREQPLSGLLTLRADKSSRDALSSALQDILSIALPERLQSRVSTGRQCVRWMSPDEWLLSCSLDETFALEQRLRKSVDGHIAIVNVSGGFTTLVLSGPMAVDVLSRSTSYNINPENFPTGKVVNTVMAKSQVTLRALDEYAFEIIVRRSLADYLCLWLQRAGRENSLQFSGAG